VDQINIPGVTKITFASEKKTMSFRINDNVMALNLNNINELKEFLIILCKEIMSTR